MEWAEQFFSISPFLIYAGVVLAPSIHEDAAVLSVTAAAAAEFGDPFILLPLVFIGLLISGAWKYGLGRMARTRAWAQRFARHPRVTQARDQVVTRLGMTLLTVRFVPGTRIPFFIACGYFQAPLPRYLTFLAIAAAAYVGAAFAIFELLDETLGDQVYAAAPYAAITLFIIMLGIQVWLHRRYRRRTPPDA